MNSDTATRHLQLAELLELAHQEEELYIIFEPDGLTAWGWGYTEEAARAAALRRVEELDATDPPEAGEDTAVQYVARCAAMCVTVHHRFALDLLALMGLTAVAGQSEAPLHGNVFPLAH